MCIIKGFGLYAPQKVLTNDELSGMVDTNDEWIASRTGIKQRRIAADGQACSDLCLEASLAALENSGVAAEELTHIIVATFTADYPIPSAACLLEHKLGLRGLAAMDVSAACSGFLYALETARAFVSLNPEAKVLVAASDILSRRTNWTDRATCVLFGDAAGAVVVTADDDSGDCPKVLDVILSSDGALGELLTVKGGGSAHSYGLGQEVDEAFFAQMNGREVYKHAVRSMYEVAMRVLERQGKTPADVDVLVPHQANLRIIEALGKKLGVPSEKVFSNVQKFGNTSAASVPVALAEAVRDGFVSPGDLMLVLTFGGGFTWGGALVRF